LFFVLHDQHTYFIPNQQTAVSDRCGGLSVLCCIRFFTQKADLFAENYVKNANLPEK